MTKFLTIFGRFSTLTKIHQNLFEGHTNVAEHFAKFSEDSEDNRRFPKIAEDFRGGPEYVSIIHQRI